MATVTMRDVAAAAGVSTATVSKVLSGRGAAAQLSAATIQRVQHVAEQLSYVPNSVARDLRARRTGQIGVVMPAPYAASQDMALMLTLDGALMTGLSMAARECHVPALVVYPQADDIVTVARSRYLDGRVDGLLVRCVLNSESALMHLVDPARLPVVALWRQIVPEHVGYADVDHYGGAIQAVEHLLNLGHRRIAYLGPDLDHDNSHFVVRYHGYCAALRAAGIPIRSHWHARSSADVLTLLRGDDPITAIFVTQDMLAAALVADLAPAQIRIPEGLSLVGFDDFAHASLIAGGLTTIHQPVQEMASQAVRQLLAMIDGTSADECRSVISPRLIVRRSTARLPQS